MAGLTEDRLQAIEHGPEMGGETTARARVIRELVAEVRRLRQLVPEEERVR